MTEHATQETQHKSKGEKFFDRFVYGGLAGVGTLLLTVPLAEALQHKWGWSQRMLGRIERGTEWLASRFLSPERSKAWAKEAANVTSLMEGGNVMLLPVGILEHYKVPLVRGANEALGDPTPPEKIQETPKQTWMSLIQGRLSAWVLVFASITAASTVFKKTFATYIEECGELAMKIFNAPKMREVVDAKGVRTLAESRAYKYGKIAALDVFATAAAATLLYVGGHFFARKHEEKKEIKAGIRPPHAHGSTRDAVEADEATSINIPSAEVVGQKAHEGLAAAAPVIAAGI